MAPRRRYKRPTKFMSTSKKRLTLETRGPWENPPLAASRHLVSSLSPISLWKRQIPRDCSWTPAGTPPSAPGTGTSSRTSETRSSEKSRISSPLKQRQHRYFLYRKKEQLQPIIILLSGRLVMLRMTERWTL